MRREIILSNFTVGEIENPETFGSIQKSLMYADAKKYFDLYDVFFSPTQKEVEELIAKWER